MSFFGSDELYVVIQPELTARSSEHKITVVRISLSARAMVPVEIESKVSLSLLAFLVRD